jgi:hypothetical protein
MRGSKLSFTTAVAQRGKARAHKHAALAGFQLGDQLVHHGQVVAVPPAADQAERLDIGLPHHVFQLMGAVGGIDRDGHRADLRGGKEEREPVRDICRPDADVVGLADADCQEPPGQIVHSLVELRVGKAQVSVGKNNELLLRKERSLALQHLSPKSG